MPAGRHCPPFFAAAFIWVLPALCFSTNPLPVEAAQEQRAVFRLRVNEVEQGDVQLLIGATDTLARLADLDRAGLKNLTGRQIVVGQDAFVSLASLASVLQWEVDDNELELRITAQPDLLATTVLAIQRDRPPNLFYSQNLSGFVNYSVSLTDFKGVDAFTEAGVSYKNNLFLTGLSRSIDGQITRGLTTLSSDNREKLTRWTFGDGFANAREALGGLSYSREFSLDPYFVRYPTLGLADAVLTPSTAEIYINGLRVREIKLPPGRFELKDLPVATGAGVTRVVIRDAFGREREIVSPYYFTSSVLQAGLHEYSYNLGFRRNNVGTSSWDYGGLAFLGMHRVGLTDALTAGLRFEADLGLVSGGPTMTALLPYGQVELSAGASRAASHSGIAGFLGYNYQQPVFSFGGSIRGMSARYANLSQGVSDDRAHLETNLFAGVQATARTSINVQHTFSNPSDQGPTHRISVFSSTRLTNWLNLLLTARHSRAQGSGVTELFAGLSFSLGDASVNIGYQRNGEENSGAISVQKSLPVGSGYGYRVQASGDRANGYQATGVAQYQGPWGRYEARYDRVNEQGTSTLNVAGALVGIGGSVFATRPVLDGFAMIQVPGIADVRGYASNQEIGTTDSRGNLLIPNLLAYYGNRLRVSDEDIPIDYRIDEI